MNRSIWHAARTVVALVAMYGLVLQMLLLSAAGVHAAAINPSDPHALCLVEAGSRAPEAPAKAADDPSCVRCVVAAVTIPAPLDIPPRQVPISRRSAGWSAQPAAIPPDRRHTPRSAQGPPHVA